MSSEAAEPVFKKRKTGSSRPAFRAAAGSLQDDGADSSATLTANSEVVQVARQSNAIVQGSSGLKAAKKRSRRTEISSDSEIDDPVNAVGVSYASRKQEARERSKSPKAGDVVAGDEAIAQAEAGLYKGQKAYGSQLPKGSARYGPIKGPDNVRTITMTDYKPDICKDYKETGYCGFGDSCIFLHDRSDYLHGWQLDNMYLSQQASKNAATAADSDEDDLPFACYICREEFTDPVVTRCGHFFCSACALKRYHKTSKCAACGAATNGIFNKAEKILERSKKYKKMREQDENGGEPISEDESGGLAGVEGLATAADDDA